MITATPLAMIAAVAIAATAPAPRPAPLEALPKGVTVARLATPLAQPVDPVLDGRIWHCEGDTCRVNASTSARAQSIARECESASHSLGAFATYQTGAVSLDGDDLARCNAHAR